MGSFATNITLVRVAPSAVEPLLVEAGRSAFIGGQDIHTVVYDEQGEAQDGSHAALAQELSARLGCVAVASLNHDDDILYLQVFEGGEVRGEYNSAPDYFADAYGFDDPDAEPDAGDGGDVGVGGERFSLGLDPARFAALVGHGDADRLAALMAGDEVFASDLHHAVASELGLPTAACGFGFTYLARGELPDELGDDDLHRVP
jgi:hypothetical protein